MARAKIAVILSKEASEWQSCRIITPNLFESYRQAFGDRIQTYSFEEDMKRSQAWELAGRIHDDRPEKLVILDHRPHPKDLIEALKLRYGRKQLPPIYVHVYGDFTLYTHHWKSIEPILRKTTVVFVCASHRQKQLVENCLKQSKLVAYCPFPVDYRQYGIDEALRLEWRKKLGVKPSEWMVLYTGRLSLQKNILRMIQELSVFARAVGIPYRLFLAGGFDDLGAPFFGNRPQKGSYYFEYQKLLRDLPAQDRNRIEFLGEFDAAELKALYNAADLYFSLSVHHDEDFGMSPAEALACGTPVTLTSWGGYSSFQLGNSRSPHCRLVPVKIGADGIQISSIDIAKALFEGSALPNQPEDRRLRSELYRKHFSIEAAAVMIQGIHSTPFKPFRGFNSRMNRLAKAFSQDAPFPQGPKNDKLYREIYVAYTRTKKNR